MVCNVLKIFKKLSSLFFVAVLISIPILYFIVDWDKSQSEFNSPTYLDELKETALSGDPNAMHRLGNNYYYGYNGLRLIMPKH